MRDRLDRALDTYPDYPPGCRPCDLEPRGFAEETIWNHRCMPIHTDHSNRVRLYLMVLHCSWICTGVC
jgi:hypothetical protein